MSTLLNALQTAGNALDVFERQIGVVQDNVVNASTPGYAKQQLSVSALPLLAGSGFAGGIQANGIENARSQFAEASVRDALTQQGYATQRASTLGSIESVFDITGQSGLSKAINDLFSACSSWSEAPTDITQRQGVINAAQSFVVNANQTAADLRLYSAQVHQGLSGQIVAVNNLTQEISAINRSNQGNPNAASANDSELNSALEQLSQIVNFSTLTASDGTTTVLLDGQIPLVVGGRSYPVSLSMVAAGTNSSPAEAHLLDAGGNDITAHATGASLGGLLSVSTGELAALLGNSTSNGSLNDLVTALASKVNSLLTGGQIDQNATPTMGVALFSVSTDATSAATLSLNAACDATQLAAIAGGPPLVSNGIANQLASLAKDTSTMPGGLSFIEYFGKVAADVGTRVNTAQTAKTRQTQLVSQAKSLRTQISGVSLNDEAARLTELQQAYQASSRVFTVVSQLMDELMHLIN